MKFIFNLKYIRVYKYSRIWCKSVFLQINVQYSCNISPIKQAIRSYANIREIISIIAYSIKSLKKKKKPTDSPECFRASLPRSCTNIVNLPQKLNKLFFPVLRINYPRSISSLQQLARPGLGMQKYGRCAE